MKAKLYSTIQGQEKFLGTFDAETFTPPNRPENKQLVVHGKRDISVPLDTLTRITTNGCTFRAEIV